MEYSFSQYITTVCVSKKRRLLYDNTIVIYCFNLSISYLTMKCVVA